jgi:phospho-N-acetylmuramoyl-pentapeptide-transferase
MLTTRLCVALILFAVAVYAQGIWIHCMRRLEMGEAIKSYGPAGHKKKRGTPSMGGIVAFALAPAAAFLIYLCGQASRTEMALIWSYPLLAGAIGLTDDLIKSIRRSSEGLRSFQKLFLQILACAAWVYFIVREPIFLMPGYALPDRIGAPLLVFFGVGALNAVNVTDGLDGLAGSAVAVSLVSFFMWTRNAAVLSSSAAGIALAVAFLWHNFNPAQVFMGDVGSHFWGGLLVSLCLESQSLALVIPAGFIFGMELLTSAIQIATIRLFNKRIFKMSPLHHHFELSGMSENKIVCRFVMAHAVGIVVITIFLEAVLRGPGNV